MDEMLTVEEVAEILKVKPLTVRQMFRERRLRAFKIGKAWRTTRAWLEQDLRAMSLDNPVPLPPETGSAEVQPENRTGRGRRTAVPRQPRKGTSAPDAAGALSDTALPAPAPEPAADMAPDGRTEPREITEAPVSPATSQDDNVLTVSPHPDGSAEPEQEPVRPEDPQQYLF